jgi:hypothetical protein
VHVADPSRELKALTLVVKRSGGDPTPCEWAVPLPNGTAVGSTVVGELSCYKE